ncbi:phospholipase A2 inhibitor and Ly6/PLAUR domain-containing protein-like [Eublepharis macularius]|uniref:Phospholipase A2 inhibitor and Ly6/PLAUR domain-containing protein-like n=1 Tax=Eublepharis macularius TaxID=481883 RepID=A0AA97KGH0_EUBMA|nr:phospholipase A2 inhibitor and Ly6/PLAUR domain-containing protein-like [Eublepharis macularius]
MQALFGLFLFTLLFTTGASLECESCAAEGYNCAGQKQSCPAGLDTCLTLVVEGTTGGQTVTSVGKMCYARILCNLLKPGQTFNVPQVTGTIKEVTCKALSLSASLLVAFLGLLMLKVLF